MTHGTIQLNTKMILSLFQKFKAEAEYIGRILAGYTDLEFGLLMCVNAPREDFDTIFKTMYRTRGETARISIADAFGRHSFESLGLGTEFAMGIGAIRRCMQIRNQYAHCTWMDGPTGQLGFVDFEDMAKANAFASNLGNLTTYFVTPAILKEQEEYFFYTDLLLIWLQKEALLKLGKIQKNIFQKPAQITQPPLHMP